MRQKTYVPTCAPSEDSDQSAHSSSLIRPFNRPFKIAKDAIELNARLYELRIMVIYNHAFLVAVASESRVKMVICKTWTGTLANSTGLDQTPQALHCLL